MTIHNMQTTTFDKFGFEQWKEAAVQSLKGKPFDSLITKTIEGIDLQPLYTQESLAKRGQPIRAAKKETGWIVAQQPYATDGQQFIVELKNSIERGNEAIVCDGTKPLHWDASSLAEIARLIEKYPIFITNMKHDNSFLKVFSLVPEMNRSSVNGAISVSGWTIPAGYTNVRTASADMWDAHHKGADAVTELALVLADAANQASQADNISDFADDFFVRFAVDTHFFMEISKFRAFRVLWQAFSSAYGIAEAPYVPIIATTSLRSYSKLDPYVNVLRAGNETFAAVLGGADVITVHPHNIITGPTSSSVRMARNIQLVIKEESHADKIIDPAGGSYFMETLTSELVDKAWTLFLDIQSIGGYDAFINRGQFGKLLEQRRSDVAIGKQPLIGTNVYAELTDTNFTNWEGVQIEGRLAEPFEKLAALQKNRTTRIALLTFGELKDFKPRADFVSGFLATGGMRAEWSPTFDNAQQAVSWLAVEKPNYAIVCATDTLTETVMEQLLVGRPDELIIDAAGKYDSELSGKWLNAGLNGFIFAGQDKVGKLIAINNKLKGGQTNEQA
ncbi:methylmalonyl-CoA mutase family protein [Sporosarcina sp. E16_8]|uniref:methylmalonyl-CoA mutase family protein n=1 Tax=Sporosarcina sp. E16_8 TaxID=2789295 RepID=UPI001A92B71E|nr:methylmalonyl-CoA mutase family protein [Sporosarcina sp. E16_8]MBO0586385.1 methylmalonyl-CoA mutase [Sporosarcina sp. E16_8]